jgi:hypothetical protein
MHLHVLSRLAFMLQETGFKNAVAQMAPTPEILKEARRVEAAIERSSDSTSPKEQQ